ncbi:MAG TPA: thioredoxin domain-containing protein [Anaerolineales bacterium]
MSRKDREGMSKREMFREKRRQSQLRNRLIAIGLIVLGAALVATFLILPTLQPVDVKPVTPLTRTQTDFNKIGDPNAPVKLDEYSDFQCPYCAHFSRDTEQSVLDAYVATGKVFFTYHSVGEFIGPESSRAAEAAYCAGDQNKFWEYHDYVLHNQVGENAGRFSDRRLGAFAEALSLDMNEFNSCFNNGKYKDMVRQDFADARALGIQSTPTFIISYQANGQTVTDQIQGAEAFSVFQQKLDAALAAAAAQ